MPYGEVAVRVNAIISIDGGAYSGTSIWRVKAQTQNGWPDSGINYRQPVVGDAVEFEMGNGVYVFLRPQTSSIVLCAGREHREVENLVEALRRFEGPCNAERHAKVTFVALNSAAEPSFTNFGVNYGGELTTDGVGKDLPPEIRAIANRNFALLSLTIAATSEPLSSGMVERFPWILDFPRTDACYGRPPKNGDYCWMFGNTYAQYFTTDLPW